MKKILSVLALFAYVACFSQKNEKVIKNTDLQIAKSSFEEFDNFTLFKDSSLVKKEDSTSVTKLLINNKKKRTVIKKK